DLSRGSLHEPIVAGLADRQAEGPYPYWQVLRIRGEPVDRRRGPVDLNADRSRFHRIVLTLLRHNVQEHRGWLTAGRVSGFCSPMKCRQDLGGQAARRNGNKWGNIQDLGNRYGS